MATLNEQKWVHYRGRLKNAELVVELQDLKELVRFGTDHRLRTVYSLMEGDRVAQFAMSHKGGLLLADAEGFDDLNDHRDAMASGFENAKCFYAARDKGFKDNAAYQLSLSSALTDPETYKAMVAKGFIRGFDEYRQLLSDGKVLTDLGEVKEAHRLYSIAQERGFEKWVDMLVAIEKGFANQQEYLIAKELNYTDAASLDEGRKGGFVNGDELQLARAANCRTRTEYIGFINFEAMQVENMAHDAKLLIILLSRLPENSVVPLSKLKELLEKEIVHYQDADTRRLRPWFTTQLHSRADLDNLLRKTDKVKEYGTYDHGKEQFTTHRLHNRKVVVDGSNVAYNSNGSATSVPTVRNMIRMAEQLKKKGFKDVDMIVDASLKYRLTDMELLPDLQKMVRYIEVEPNTSADMLVILHVKMHHCLMVTNDQFREWKANDPWIEDNIDYYRLTFRITDNMVLLPDLDRD